MIDIDEVVNRNEMSIIIVVVVLRVIIYNLLVWLLYLLTVPLLLSKIYNHHK